MECKFFPWNVFDNVTFNSTNEPKNLSRIILKIQCKTLLKKTCLFFFWKVMPIKRKKIPFASYKLKIWATIDKKDYKQSETIYWK